VTGVTAYVFRSVELTPVLQLVNLICAIAPLTEDIHSRSDTHPQTPTRPLTGPSPRLEDRTKKIALDPAESSAIYDAPCS
jgi:hypothetical protein